VRDEFNATHQPHCFLYLLARCVKAAIRYNAKGEFNNSPDNRRLGMRPDTMRRNILRTSELLRGKATVRCQSYQKTLRQVAPGDVVYMDPPYQGVCAARDHRYVEAVQFDEFVGHLERLNRKTVPYVVSYDGQTGDKVYGRPLPDHLGLVRVGLHAGRSTQATLLGRQESTVESLYLSRPLLDRLERPPAILTGAGRRSLFD
jgi:DNA adenine methylase